MLNLQTKIVSLGASRNQCAPLLLLVLGLISCCGCYPDWPEHAGTAEVHGDVTLDGMPINKAKVIFLPMNLHGANEKIVPLAYGLTDAEGKFVLEYSDHGKDVIAGKYTVMITKTEERSGPAILNQPFPSNQVFSTEKLPDLLPDSVLGLSKFDEQGELIPAIYNLNSTLVYEVIASPGIIRPKFVLTSVADELGDQALEDLPLK